MTDATGAAIRMPLEMLRFLTFLRRTDSHASKALLLRNDSFAFPLYKLTKRFQSETAPFSIYTLTRFTRVFSVQPHTELTTFDRVARLGSPSGGASAAQAVTEGVSLFRTKLPPTSLTLSHLPQRGRQDLAPPLGELALP